MASDLLFHVSHSWVLLCNSKCDLSSDSVSASFAFTEQSFPFLSCKCAQNSKTADLKDLP